MVVPGVHKKQLFWTPARAHGPIGPWALGLDTRCPRPIGPCPIGTAPTGPGLMGPLYGVPLGSYEGDGPSFHVDFSGVGRSLCYPLWELGWVISHQGSPQFQP